MKPTLIIIHHEGAENGFNAVNEYHRQLWNFKSALGFYCGYTYYISNNGQIHQARLDTEEGAHTKGLNKGSIGICLEGNLNLRKPTQAQLASLEKLSKEKMTQYTIESVAGHRTYRDTTCPGQSWTEQDLKNLFAPIQNRAFFEAMLALLMQMLYRLMARFGGGREEENVKGLNKHGHY